MSKDTQRAFIESLPDWKRARLEALIADARGYGKRALRADTPGYAKAASPKL